MFNKQTYIGGAWHLNILRSSTRDEPFWSAVSKHIYKVTQKRQFRQENSNYDWKINASRLNLSQFFDE